VLPGYDPVSVHPVIADFSRIKISLMNSPPKM
jgi:hypothetical protein